MSCADVRVQALADCVRAAGVVGAGGGGFSLADKFLARPYRTLIINAAQSEPLICKDWAALAHFSDCVLSGAQLLIETLDIGKAFLATREEFSAALPDLAAAARKRKVTVARLPDIYPLGYEKVLKRELLGIPMSDSGIDDVLVVNAETLRNLSWAVQQKRPVTTKLVTVAGAVARPISLQVPIGTSFDDCLAQAGGATSAQYTVFHNGVLAGKPIDPAHAWVNATTLGYVLLPSTHSAVQATHETDVMSRRLAERRVAFFESTLAGRTQAMSAAYALFDLTPYRRARLVFRALTSAEDLPAHVRITPCGQTQVFQPCVSAGEQVMRGQAIALQPDAGGIALHASVRGVVETVDGQGITLRRTDEEESST
jgi:Na+-translocating ferredoxin:NAD+ oxidoreductase RnfC subunit